MLKVKVILLVFVGALLISSIVSERTRAQTCTHDSPLVCTSIPSSLSDYDANDWMRVSNHADALQLRQELIEYIWESGTLPISVPTTTTLWSQRATSAFPNELGVVAEGHVSSVEMLTTTVDGLDNYGYLLSPRTSNKGLAVLHQGHADWATGNLDQLGNALLQDGWTVLAATMPLVGWNTDTTATLPSGEVTWARGTTGHRQMFPLPNPEIDDDNAFRFFEEPTIAGINYAKKKLGSDTKVVMIGFSGGGWTTTLAAAVDSRIENSVSVAGSFPLAIQTAQDTLGDDEQIWPGLYDVEGGGIASYEELYLLSAFGEDRSATQITNQFDPCCFFGVVGELYENAVGDRLSQIGSGDWQYLLDSTGDEHAVSAWSQQRILQLTQSVPEPAANIIMATFCCCILSLARKRRS